MDGVDMAQPASASTMETAIARLNSLVLMERINWFSLYDWLCGTTPQHKCYYTAFLPLLQAPRGCDILVKNVWGTYAGAAYMRPAVFP